ncbi:TrbI/VirB10 family protein [Nostoc sp. NIES-2111]
MSEDNNKNGSGATIEDWLHIDDAHKSNGNKQPEPESLLVPTKHTFVTSPWSRLAIITIPFGVGFLAIFLMLNGVFNPPTPQKTVQKQEEPTTTEQAQQNEEGDGDARAKLALSDQQAELNKINLSKKEQPTPVKVSQTEKVVPRTPPSPRSAPRPVQNPSPRPSPQPIRTYTPPPTRTSFAPRPSISARTVTSIDPLEQLNKLRTIGSYGKIAYAESSTSDHSSLDPAQNLPNQSQEQTDFNNNVDNDTSAQTTQQDSNDSIEKIRPRWQAQSQAKSDKYLDQERQILEGKQTRYLTVGTFANGVIVTPLVQATVNSSVGQQTSTPNNTRSVARLTQDLRDNYGQVAIQAGTLLAVELVSVDGGSVAIAHVRAIIKDNTEYPISNGAISLTGEGSRPLIAKKFQDRGGEIARNDLFGGAVSALGKVGEVINQPDSEEEIEDEFTGRIRRRSSGNRRNITGALLEGFFGQVSQNVSQRNQRATQEISSRPNAWYIAAGTKVTITVNRSVELP